MNVGRYALVSMLGLVLMAYIIGGAIRFNIRYVEPKLEKGTLNLPSTILEQLSQWALSFAYIVSVTYYLSLFGDFVLRLQLLFYFLLYILEDIVDLTF